jgi:hypothetical protein
VYACYQFVLRRCVLHSFTLICFSEFSLSMVRVGDAIALGSWGSVAGLAGGCCLFVTPSKSISL